MKEAVSGRSESELILITCVHEDMAAEEFYVLVGVLVPFSGPYFINKGTRLLI